MPVYLCQPGVMATEPWRHGIQVYAAPFDLVDLPVTASRIDGGTAGDGRDSTSDTAVSRARNNENDDQSHFEQQANAGTPSLSSQIIDVTGSGGMVQHSRAPQSGLEIRRIRHAEVVLVDDVCLAFGRHWLRLRWPGHKGGFAGYIALGKVNEPMPKQISDALHGKCCLWILFHVIITICTLKDLSSH
jgi:hypothetical protein